MVFNFENLEVYKKAEDFVNRVYAVTKRFPGKRSLWVDQSVSKSSSFNFAEYCRRLCPH